MAMTVDSDEKITSKLRTEVAGELRRFNLERVGNVDFTSLAIIERADDGTIRGGCIAETYWEWLFIEILWVRDTERARGLGSGLLARAEAEGRARGCHSVYLDTFSFQARGFYERHGYRVFGKLERFPAPFERFFMEKRLDAQ